MNYFVEGLQGSGKSTMVQKTLRVQFGLYSNSKKGIILLLNFAWCAYVDEEKYQEILEKYKRDSRINRRKVFS
jgi:hypothetical protein